MAITVADLKFFQSERMTDESDGGGQMTAVEIVSGESNNIFDDLSDVDRASGDVSIRKVFAAVTSNDTDKFLDAGVTIFAPPDDANTTCLGFSTGDFYDERAALTDAVEQYRARGIDTKLRLIGTHLPNQRTLYGYLLKPVTKEPNTLFYNATLSVASEEDGAITQEQFVQVMRVTVTDAQYIYLVNNVQTLFDVYEVVLDLTGPLQYTFDGSEENPSGGYTPPTVIRTTSVVAPYPFFGSTTLAVTAAVGATTIELDDTKALIAPMDYQDLGATELTCTNTTMAMWVEAPDGFSTTVTLTPAPVGTVTIAYEYGGSWIITGEPNAAVYYPSSGHVSFPLRPDDSSFFFLEWTFSESKGGVETFVHSQGTPTVTSALAPFPYTVDAYAISLASSGTIFIPAATGSDTLGIYTYTCVFSNATGELVWSGDDVVENSVTLRYPLETDAAWGRTSLALLLSNPVIAGSLVVTAATFDDQTTLTATDQGDGTLSGDSITGTINYANGRLAVTFPEAVKPDTINVSYHQGGFLPQPEDMLGIDSIRLPNDGRMPIFADNQLALIHHTDTVVEEALSPAEVISCGRTALYRVAIDDAAGRRLPDSFYTVDRDMGTVTMSPSLDLTGYSGSYTIYHTIADLRRINHVSHSLSTLTLTLGLSREFAADETRVSSVLFIGTMQARYTNLFSQSTWTSVWSDAVIGDEILAQYNDTLYPVGVSNLGAYTDRILIKFTSATAFQVIGENLGFIGIGNVNENCTPINSLTGQPYFTLDYRGWGAGWATGNCLRFNLIGANYPIDLVRAIQPSAPTGADDSVELLLVGNVDA